MTACQELVLQYPFIARILTTQARWQDRPLNLQSPRKSQTPLSTTTNLVDVKSHDQAFEAIQISQIMIFECEILKSKISGGSKENAIEIVDSLSKRAIRIGMMMRKLREKGQKQQTL